MDGYKERSFTHPYQFEPSNDTQGGTKINYAKPPSNKRLLASSMMDPTLLQYPSYGPSFIDSPHTSSWLNSGTFGKFNWCIVVHVFIRMPELEALIQKNLEIDCHALASLWEMDRNHYVSSHHWCQHHVHRYWATGDKTYGVGFWDCANSAQTKGTVLEKL